jgi:Uma2 family endonuclease
MSTLTLPIPLTPDDVERASMRDAKHYELINGELKEKIVGFRALFIAGRIAERLNQRFYPAEGAAAVEAMTYCFQRPNHGRKPDVVYVARGRWPNDQS